MEIDEAVIRASREHLPKISAAFSNPKLEMIVGDGIQFIKDAKPGTYDLIIDDTTSVQMIASILGMRDVQSPSFAIHL